MNRSRLTPVLLRFFVVSVAVNAILGIWALLAGDFGDTQGRILSTSFLVSATMLSVLVNAPAMGRRALWPVPAVGAAAAVVGFLMLIAMVWADADAGDWIKTAMSFLVVAGGATLAGNLALVGLPDRLRVLQPIVGALIAVLVATILIAIWNEGGADWFARLIGVLSVLVAAGTLLIPALARFAAPADGPSPGPATAAVRYCPSCGRPMADRALGTAVACPSCGLVFEVLEATPTSPPSRQA